MRIVLPRYLLWLGCAALVVALLWPALWVDPAGAFRNYLEEIVSNGGRPNGDGQFFFGRAVADPGPLFYPIANLFRMTPVTMLGLLAYFGFTIYDLGVWWRSPIENRTSNIEHQNVLLVLGAFVLFWTLVMTLGPEDSTATCCRPGQRSRCWPRQDWWGWLACCAGHRPPTARIWFSVLGRVPSGWFSALGAALVVTALLFTDFWYHPYYLSYYNPLLGGGVAAQRALLIGWGEGMDQAGAYLREQPDIGHGPVLSALGATLQPFVPVLVRDVSRPGDAPANYAVVYIESIQRAANPPIYEAIEQTVPLRTITIHGIDYAKIYQLPRPFERRSARAGVTRCTCGA